MPTLKGYFFCSEIVSSTPFILTVFSVTQKRQLVWRAFHQGSSACASSIACLQSFIIRFKLQLNPIIDIELRFLPVRLDVANDFAHHSLRAADSSSKFKVELTDQFIRLVFDEL
jgi:hypothetical protein